MEHPITHQNDFGIESGAHKAVGETDCDQANQRLKNELSIGLAQLRDGKGIAIINKDDLMMRLRA
jgi:hypothetical protein